ncbi:MAG TPA: putative sugar nucleotidyl transferase [Phycisphaerae bacterium]|nr:putative sugar nucleotidyl transferase [Phycisphaerae bacterium]
MPPLYVFEDSQTTALNPLTYTRAAFELRCGHCTLLERMERNLGRVGGVLVRAGLAELMRRRLPSVAVNPPLETKDGILLINGRCLFLKGTEWSPPDYDCAGLSHGTVVWMNLSPTLAAKVDLSRLHEQKVLDELVQRVQHVAAHAAIIDRPWDLFAHQKAALLEDFAVIGAANFATVMPGAHLLNPDQIHLGRGTKVWPGAVLDAQNGPILIGEAAEIRANCVITGPASIGTHCVIRNVADIREETSIGPGCRVGGEINGSIFLGNANKQHHGFIGQTIVGEWANLGAGTTTSNMKNTYGTVKMPLNGVDESSGRLFLGAIIGDHAKLGIGTYLSTGSVVGFASHVVVPRPPRFVPSFAWVTDKGVRRADFEKLEQIAATVMVRRHAEFTPADHELWVRIASEWALAEKHAWEE